MQGTIDRFLLFVVTERARHTKRLRLPSLMVVLIAILLYQTQWPVLRPGLAILLAGQAGVMVALFLRSVTLAEDLNRRNSGVLDGAAVVAWFAGEEAFVKRLAFFESGCQTLGFAALGYAFWTATQSLWLALAIGLVYPITTYLGITHRRNLKTLRQLEAEKQEIVFRNDRG